MALHLHRGDTSGRVSWWSIVGIALVPLLIAGGFLAATWHSDQRLDTVTAAIVNNDEPVKINGQTVPLGRQLAGGLVTSGGEDSDTDPDQNYDWVLSDTDDAADGLRSGKYAAVVTIPENFSKAATSYSKEAADAEQATIDVDVSKATSIVDPALSRAIVSTAVDTLNTELTKSYLDNIYIGFNDLNKQFSTVADASGKISDGADDLSDGVAQTDKGVTQLSDGLDELSTNGNTLSRSVGTYTDGVSSLSTGLGQLAAGTKELPSQTRQLATGASGISTGVGKLADGAGELADGAAQLNKGVPALATGSTQLAQGAAGLDQGLGAYSTAMQGLPQTITCEQAGITDPTQCQAFSAGVAAASQAAVQGLTTSQQQGAPSLTDLAGSVSTGATGLATGINGTDKQPGLAAGIKGLSTGASRLATGTDELGKGAKTYAKGVDTFADNVPALSKGIADSASGASQLASGGSQLDTGVQQYTQGVTKVADGVDDLEDGTGQLATGAQQLAKGSRQLTDGLEKGADAVPTYDKSERENLSTVVSAPVDQPSGADDGIFSDVSAFAFLIAVALWVGALTAYLVIGTGVRQAWTSTSPSWRVAARGMLVPAAIGVLQAGILTTLSNVLLDLDASATAAVFGVSALAALAFVAVNYALVGLFGGFGRFVSVIAVVLTAAGGLLSAVPAFFTTVRPFLPLTPALDGIAATAGDGSGTGTAVGLLLAWLIIGCVASVLAVARHRQLSLSRVVSSA